MGFDASLSDLRRFARTERGHHRLKLLLPVLRGDGGHDFQRNIALLDLELLADQLGLGFGAPLDPVACAGEVDLVADFRCAGVGCAPGGRKHDQAKERQSLLHFVSPSCLFIEILSPPLETIYLFIAESIAQSNTFVNTLAYSLSKIR